MCEQIEIYDIDGTLTYGYGDISDNTGFDSYAFWPLISYHFTKEEKFLRESVTKWDESIKKEVNPTGSSHRMMQAGIDTFRDGVTAEDIRKRGKDITLKFIQHSVIRHEAIKYLSESINREITCVLSTGSYKDGALGFVDALIEKELLDESDAEKLVVSGAIVDWDNKKLQHANVLENKIVGLEKELELKKSVFQSMVKAVFADDPYVNDKDLITLAPEGRSYIITTTKNKSMEIPEYCTRASWKEICAFRNSVVFNH